MTNEEARELLRLFLMAVNTAVAVLSYLRDGKGKRSSKRRKNGR